jgi:glycosyltransferase involved in cell wall biosynthesis
MVTVLHVTQPTDAGVGAYVAGLGADQARRGWEVVVACPGEGPLAEEVTSLGISRLDWPADRAAGANAAGEAVRLHRLLADSSPDVLHLHSSKAGLAGRLAARGQVPTIFQPHGWSWLAAPGWMAPASVAWERWAGRWTSLYVCVCRAEAEQARARGLRGRYQIVHSGVDLHRFRPVAEPERRSARARLGVPAQRPLVACVGRVTRQKGQDVLLAAWPAVRDRCPDALLAVVGGGDLLEPLRRGAPAGVVFTGPVPDTRPWYAAADLVVLPSRWEGLPLTLLEAQAMGRSVVGSDIASIVEALPAGGGAVVPVGDPVAFAAAIARRAGDPGLVRAEGAVGARHAAATADVRGTHDRLAALTARLARERNWRRTTRGTRGWPPGWPGTTRPRAGSSR